MTEQGVRALQSGPADPVDVRLVGEVKPYRGSMPIDQRLAEPHPSLNRVFADRVDALATITDLRGQVERAAKVCDSYADENQKLSDRATAAESRVSRLEGALKVFLRAAYPVASEINKRGWNWSEAYLDEAKENAESELKATRSLPVTAAPQPVAWPVDLETVQTLLDLLNPLHGKLDEQLYVERVRHDFDCHRDDEHDVIITIGMERDLTQAVSILEDRKRQFPAAPSFENTTGEKK